jgi:hypothetical protein
MSTFPKHEATTRQRQDKQAAAETTTSIEVERIVDAGYSGLSELGQHLEGIYKELGAYFYNATLGEHSLSVFTAKNSHPLRLSLEGDAVDSIADSIKRIADAMEKGGVREGV